ncbi:MAG: single-stranded-DNA-specific exonuclease RecJ [Elusimicrobia bacterium]|nr:single-stranded-DNA-specific exonuclease RecJ [Elusimicrobiota bacterium]
MHENKWIFLSQDADERKLLSEQFNVSERLGAILLNRNINAGNAGAFLHGSYEELLNPFLFGDMRAAALRLRSAVDKGEKILVYGDRDVDGITAVNILALTIKKLGGDVSWYVPSDEGYGISKDVIDSRSALGTSLIVTADCGISAAAEINYAQSLGIDIIVTDHHEPPAEGLPKAFAVINPKTQNSNYPFKELAGCSVALKLAEALMLTFGKRFDKKTIFVSGGYFIETLNDICVLEGMLSGLELKDDKDLKIVSNNENFLAEISAKVPQAQTELFNEDNVSNTQSLMQAYFARERASDGRMKQFFDDNADVVALGTIADIVPLVGENRVFVKEGIKSIEKNIHRRPGLGFIIEDNLISKNSGVTARSIAWNVTPVLNSAGRMGKAPLSCELLMEFNEFHAKNIYADILKLNDSRRDLQSTNIAAFNALLKEQTSPDDKILTLCAQGLDHGVTGIVAAQLVRQHSKPVVLLISDGSEAVGAARSIEGFDIVQALENVKDILVKYGGHSQAAGFTVAQENVEQLKARLKEYAKKIVTPLMMTKTIQIDSELKISDLTTAFCKEIQILEPFGMGNPQPNFCVKNVTATEISAFGVKREHLKFKLSQNGNHNITAVYWNSARLADSLKTERVIDVIFNLELNRGALQLTVLDTRPSVKK